MAERRMISKTVTQTQKFLKMPLEAQALYFHLMINADDDGIVEAFPVVRMIGASDDSLGLLVVKQFIKCLNDEMVYFIIDFNDQNRIRKDRHKPSKHRDLLTKEDLQKIPHTLPVRQVSDTCPQTGGQMSAQYSIVEDSIVESSLDQSSLDEDSQDTQKIVNVYQRRIGVIDGQQFKMLKDFVTIDKMDTEVIVRAIGQAADNGVRNFSYILAILRNWKQDGIKTIVQVDERENKRIESKARQQQSQTSNVPHWSEPEYVNNTTAEEQAELDKKKQELLKKYDIERGED